MKMSPLHNRAGILLFFLFLWAALVAAHLFYYSIIASDKFIKRGNALAKRNGIIRAKRGRIFSKDGTKLAWSERIIDLYIDKIPELPFYRTRLEDGIAEYFIDFTFMQNSKGMICLQKNLSPTDQVHFYPLVKRFPEVIFKERIKRRYISGEVSEQLKKMEEKYNIQLKGKDGFFEVMADRNGKWIPKTWHEKVKAVDGQDIKIELGSEGN